jgi:hypothetical protein
MGSCRLGITAGWTTTISGACAPGTRQTFICTPGGTAGPLWGTDDYTSDSSVCTAAVHAGKITFASGGTVTIEHRAGMSTYAGSARHGVTSASWGSWSCSFVLVP